MRTRNFSKLKRMTAKELRSILAELPDDASIFISGYEGGCHDVEKLRPITVGLDALCSTWDGPHDWRYFSEGFDEQIEGYIIEGSDCLEEQS